MKLQIEKPDFQKYYKEKSIFMSYQETLDQWFDEHIQPLNKLLSEVVEVYENTDDDAGFYYWHDQKDSSTRSTALLINIQPIKKETAEDVLRDIVAYDKAMKVDMVDDYKHLHERAKAVLDE